MGSQKCSEPGCMFYLPEKYPFDTCPWHLAPGSDVKTKVAVTGGALCLLGAGYGLSQVLSIRESKKKQRETSKAQQEWRAKTETRSQSSEAMSSSEDHEGSLSDAVDGKESQLNVS